MKNGGIYVLYAVMALVFGCFALGAGYLQSRVLPQHDQRRAIGARLSEGQMISRRRAAINTAAIAGTTAQ